jgi:hypothetical protein
MQNTELCECCTFFSHKKFVLLACPCAFCPSWANLHIHKFCIARSMFLPIMIGSFLLRMKNFPHSRPVLFSFFNAIAREQTWQRWRGTRLCALRLGARRRDSGEKDDDARPRPFFARFSSWRCTRVHINVGNEAQRSIFGFPAPWRQRLLPRKVMHSPSFSKSSMDFGPHCNHKNPYPTDVWHSYVPLSCGKRWFSMLLIVCLTFITERNMEGRTREWTK